MTKSYRCQGIVAKFPDGGTITCRNGQTVQKPGQKCTVSCDVGAPNYEEIECKAVYGWRPDNKLECNGVSPGVVVGALFGGIVAVVLIAYLYAKYKQSTKKKELKKNPPPPKNSRRPGYGTAAKPQQPVAPQPPDPLELVPQKIPISEGSNDGISNNRRLNSHRNPPAPIPRKSRIPDPPMEPDEWSFRNQAYDYDHASQHSFQNRYPQYQAYPYYGEEEQPQIGFDHMVGAPPPRPSRDSGVYTISNTYR